MIVYRCIRFESDNEDSLDYQLKASLEDGVYRLGRRGAVKMSIKTREDDPNERGFWNNLSGVEIVDREGGPTNGR